MTDARRAHTRITMSGKVNINETPGSPDARALALAEGTRKKKKGRARGEKSVTVKLPEK